MAVVLLGELLRDLHDLGAHEAQAGPLDPGDHLSGEALPEGVGLYQNERVLQCHGFLQQR